jgi:hypothetical protein
MQNACRVAATLVLCLGSIHSAHAEQESTTALADHAAEFAESSEFVVLPDHLTLDGPEASHQILVHSVRKTELGGAEIGAPALDVTFHSDDESIATVEEGRVVPVGNGKTTIQIRQGDAVRQGETARSIEVVVRGMQESPTWSFRHDVQPILTKAGCNSGACHGALAGKGGFRLSLHGYDPLSDYFAITQHAKGRRIELGDPGRSLLLAKPTGGIPHKGGVRFEVESEEYRILSEWIAAGLPEPREEDAHVERIEVLPESAQLKPGDEQQILVRAHYSNGRVLDVTRRAKFASTNEAVASINDQGRLEVTGYGEGAVTAWFDSQIVIARVTSPFPNEVEPDIYRTSPRANFIDDLVLDKLRKLNLPPSPQSDDSEFIRRVFLDTIGTLPTAEEVREFLAESAPDKRQRLIDELLERPEFVDYWTHKWSDILLINGQLLRPAAVKSYYTWVRDQVAANRPWDEFVREILTSQGSSLEQGATNFFALHQDPEEMTENVCQAFLGLSIGCAKCHNHPLEKWTNDQYYGMANMFARVRAKGWGGDSRNGDGARTLYVASRGELIQPLTGKPQPPRPLDGEPLDFDDPEDRRIYLAQWLTAPENPYFARSITNRVWANFFGVGLVEPVDDMRLSNPASNEELLAAAAEFLIEQQFDLKKLMRVILQSQTYQRSSQALPENEQEQRYYSRYYPRRLMAEVLLDGISQVTGVPTPFTEVAFPGADRAPTDFYPKGTRAIQLYDSAVASYFLESFGRNQRMITCECERSNEPSLVQALHISNGTTINQKLKSPDNQIDQLLEQDLSLEELIEEIYLSALARSATESERSQLLEVMREADEEERRQVVEDLIWSVLSSREFLFNH